MNGLIHYHKFGAVGIASQMEIEYCERGHGNSKIHQITLKNGQAEYFEVKKERNKVTIEIMGEWEFDEFCEFIKNLKEHLDSQK